MRTYLRVSSTNGTWAILFHSKHIFIARIHTRSIKFYMKHILVFVLINYIFIISTKELCVVCVCCVCVWVCGLWKRINMKMIFLHIFLYYYAISILTVVNSVANSTSHNATRAQPHNGGEQFNSELKWIKSPWNRHKVETHTWSETSRRTENWFDSKSMRERESNVKSTMSARPLHSPEWC